MAPPAYADATRTVPNNTHAQWWKDSGLRKLNAMIGCVITAQMTCGYDEAVISNLQAMTPWTTSMGNPSSSQIGLLTTIIFIGAVAGSWPASLIADTYGRKWGMFCGSFLAFAGTVVQSSAIGYAQFIVGRYLIGVGIGFILVAGPSLTAELAHPRQRGTVLGFFNTLWYGGAIVAAWGSFGSGHINSSWSWRIPSIIQGVAPLFLMIMLPFMPESPRFLLSVGRAEEAREILAHYHANGQVDDELVKYEIDEINDSLALERKYQGNGWALLWNTAAARKKMALALGSFMICLWCGQGVISYYFSPVLVSVKISSTDQQTGINGGMQIWNFLMSIAGACLADRIGRRPLWLISLVGMMCANIGVTVTCAVYEQNSSKGAAYMVVIFLFLYNGAYNLACNPLAYAYPTEVLPYNIRTKGMAVVVAVGMAMLIVAQYANPIAYANIGWKYWCFYLGMLVLFISMVYLFFPETRGLSLEELGQLYEDESNPNEKVVVEGIEAESVEEFAVNAEKKGLADL